MADPRPRLTQPELVNEWGTPFRGRAETITGDVWWYTVGHKRYPLLPAAARALKDADNESHHRDNEG